MLFKRLAGLCGMNESGMRMKGIMETSYEALNEHNSELIEVFLRQ